MTGSRTQHDASEGSGTAPQPRQKRMTALRLANPIVRTILRSPFHGMLSRHLMLITIRGRRTGRPFTLPVGYLQEGDTVLVLIGEPERKTWWRNLEGGSTAVQVLLRGRTMEAVGDVLTWDTDREAEVEALTRFATRSRGTARALGIERGDGIPDPASVRAAAPDVVMVRIKLAATGPGTRGTTQPR